jgi:2-polyprenyl-6-methoxyphenol hydroxylase-like FAD-dependent oxidoreductase
MRALDIGVVGCGTAGPAAALFLGRQGHAVTLYERVERPGPVGAGIMLQPTGQAVLSRLGLLEEVLARGARIDRLRVERRGGGRLLDLSYRDVSEAFFGVGLHRGVLFEALFGAVRRAPIALCLGVTADRLEAAGGGRLFVVDDRGERRGPHDLVIVADGARSRLRDGAGLARAATPYPWGALWFMAEDPEHRFTGELYQVVHGARRLVGLLPTGLGPASRGGKAVPEVSLFYSVRADARDEVLADFDGWKRDVLDLVPSAGGVLEQIRDPAEVLFSAYHDVVMQPWHGHAVVFLGDAAHAMSPQLGQGANLALFDALVLADCVEAERGEVVRALDAYSRARRDHLGYYQLVTRWLTPLFQGDNDAFGVLRDVFFPLANRVPLFNRAMVLGMCGIADGTPWTPLALPGAEAARALPAAGTRMPG